DMPKCQNVDFIRGHAIVEIVLDATEMYSAHPGKSLAARMRTDGGCSIRRAKARSSSSSIARGTSGRFFAHHIAASSIWAAALRVTRILNPCHSGHAAEILQQLLRSDDLTAAGFGERTQEFGFLFWSNLKRFVIVPNKNCHRSTLGESRAFHYYLATNDLSGCHFHSLSLLLLQPPCPFLSP